MRADIVPGSSFPDYKLSDHTRKHRNLSDLQAQDPTVPVLAREAFYPNDRGQHERLLQLRIGHFFADREVQCRKISTLRRSIAIRDQD